MMHDLLTAWFRLVEQWGYWGVFVLMAVESSIVPLPSEVVMPPAAFWAAQGRMSFWGVVAAGTFGSYVGSAIGYWAAQWIGLPLLHRYGRYVFLPEKKLQLAEQWVAQYGVAGVFTARLLPVLRHLVSYPAGLFRMPFGRFSAATLIGAGIWCWVLSWFGQEVIGSHPELLNSPEEMIAVMKLKLRWFVAGVVVLGLLYGVVMYFKKGHPRPASSS